VVGLRIQPKHANARGIAHGGILMTMCDIALGYRTTRSQTPSPMLTTASVKTDFAGSAKIGDWVEAHVDVHKVGGGWPSPTATSRSATSASCTRRRCSRGRRPSVIACASLRDASSCLLLPAGSRAWLQALPPAAPVKARY
jgi:hypothetical protein